MDKNSILSKTSGSPKKLPLEKSKNPAYSIITVAKNSGQNWRSETIRCTVASVLSRGFFYACKIYYKHIKATFDKMHRVMVDCLKESSDSLLSLWCSTPISTIRHLFQLALEKMVVSKYHKETTDNV